MGKKEREKKVIRTIESYDALDEEYKKEKRSIWNIIYIILLIIIFLPLIIIGLIITFFWAILTRNNFKKCEQWRVCPWYNSKSEQCNEDMGLYYDYNKYSGCYYAVQDRKEELRKQGKVLRRLR